MLDLTRYARIRLSPRPLFQRVIAAALLTPNYYLPPRVRIEFEGLEHLPSDPVIFAMNHTDRYNYWPFQYKLYRSLNRFTATWVKGKYYENELLGRFMEWTNNIPTVSRGYLVTRDFVATAGRPPSDEEYRCLRDWVDAAAGGTDAHPASTEQDVPPALLHQARDVFGRSFEPGRGDYAGYINAVFDAMMARFVELNAEAFDKGLDLLVFPQGTRSIRLSRGHIGLAQIALRFQKTIVPVGSNGCDQIYPSGSPVARGGRVVYRFGPAIPFDEMADFHVDEPFEPFTQAAETRHRERFRGLTDLVMERINALLDPPYQFAPDGESDGTQGSRRFV